MTRQLPRRGFLSIAAGSLPALSAVTTDRPAVTKPRATSGDTAVEPDWEQQLVVTVGNKDADLVGSGEKVIQAAVDHLARFGGGTVKVLPGIYRLRNSVFLSSNVRILGSGEDSLLIKEPSVETKLAQDSDWYDQEITLVNAAGFNVGDGICLRTQDVDNTGVHVLKRTLVARSGNRFKLDKPLRENFWIEKEPTVTTVFPLLTGEFVADITIENIALDGNQENNAYLDGNYGG